MDESTKHQEITPIFVSSQLDDFGLRPAAFRVFARVARRGRCTESVDNIAAGCKLHPDTVKACLKELVAFGILFRTVRDGATSIYEVAPLSKWNSAPRGNEGPALEITGGENKGHHPGEMKGPQFPEMEGHHPGEMKGHKGNPSKGITEGNPIKEQTAASAAVVAAIPISPAFPQVLDTPAFRTAWDDWLAYRRERKIPKLLSRSLSAQLNTLAEWGHDAAIASIRDSIRQQWQGLFAPKSPSPVAAINSSGLNRYQQPVVTAEEHAKGFFGDGFTGEGEQ